MTEPAEGTLRRIVLVRHGETDGNSSVRLHGSSDVALSAAGRAHVRAAAAALDGQHFDLHVASPLRRSWESAWIVSGGRPVRLVDEFREIHFGRWEGMTKEEIEASDPVGYQAWTSGAEGFEYPGGERRADFRDRVGRGVRRLLAEPVRSAVLVVHKGVVRAVVRELTGEELPADAPPLGGIVHLTRDADGSWFVGKRSSNPPALEESAA